MQKLIFSILVLTTMLSSCSESFKLIDPAEFNQKIATRTDIKTSEELIKLYYNYPQDEAEPKLTITSRKISKVLISATLTHDYQEDDSQRATKIIMTASLENKKWFVEEIKTNWKCWEGRGHTNWGTEFCN